MNTETVTRFGLIRHVQTRWNRQQRIQGQSDSPLTAAGRNQAAAWGNALAGLGWDRILCSDLGRALETAAIIQTVLGVPLRQDSRLRELDWGRWTGKTLSQLGRECPQTLAREFDRGWEFCPPDGEGRTRLLQRGKAALAAAAERWPGAAVLTVTHEGMIKSLVYHCLKRRFLPDEKPVLKKAHLHWLAIESGELRLEQLNAVALHPRRAV
jgi:probable phosphoglycerate mutase